MFANLFEPAPAPAIPRRVQQTATPSLPSLATLLTRPPFLPTAKPTRDVIRSDPIQSGRRSCCSGGVPRCAPPSRSPRSAPASASPRHAPPPPPLPKGVEVVREGAVDDAAVDLIACQYGRATGRGNSRGGGGHTRWMTRTQEPPEQHQKLTDSSLKSLHDRYDRCGALPAAVFCLTEGSGSRRPPPEVRAPQPPPADGARFLPVAPAGVRPARLAARCAPPQPRRAPHNRGGPSTPEAGPPPPPRAARPDRDRAARAGTLVAAAAVLVTVLSHMVTGTLVSVRARPPPLGRLHSLVPSSAHTPLSRSFLCTLSFLPVHSLVPSRAQSPSRSEEQAAAS